MNKYKKRIARGITFLTLFSVSVLFFCSNCNASEQLQLGNKYKTIGTLYLSGVYRNLNNRQLNKQMAFGSLTPFRFSGTEVAFQCPVPVGTIITIIGLAPKPWALPFLPDRYFVQLDPDLSRGLDIILQLKRGIEGSLDGLNPKLFSRLQQE